jgi:membrane associated rhomboid family serine protease
MLPWVLVALLVANILPEVMLQLADRGVMGPIWLRALVYRLATFQRDLIATGGPLFPGQTLAMFFTYGFVHTGLGHLAVNMAGLIWLGRILLRWRTTGTFVIFYAMGLVGAAEVFALIGPAGGAVTGASGALFALLGVYVVDTGLLSPQQGEAAWGGPVVRIILATVILALADVASQQVLGSAVAWQAHAGGFATGALMALAAPPRYKYP